jgi:hypothetical protein
MTGYRRPQARYPSARSVWFSTVSEGAKHVTGLVAAVSARCIHGRRFDSEDLIEYHVRMAGQRQQRTAAAPTLAVTCDGDAATAARTRSTSGDGSGRGEGCRPEARDATKRAQPAIQLRPICRLTMWRRIALRDKTIRTGSVYMM